MQEFDIDWVLVNEADLTLERIFSYDPFNRRNGETLGANGSTLYTDLAGNVIEERRWSIDTAQNVLSPATGELILRDRDTDNNPATRYSSTVPAGIEQRIHAIYDGQGNVSAITTHLGTVLERYFYTPDGNVQMTNAAASSTLTSSGYDWRYLFKGGRQDGTGIYKIGGGEWDYLTGGTLEHDAPSYWNDHQAYTPASLGFYDQAVITTVPILMGVTIGVATGGLGFAAAGFFGGLAGGFAGGFTNMYGAGGSIGGSLGSGAVGGAIGGVAGLAGGAVAGRFLSSALPAAGVRTGTTIGQQVMYGLPRAAAVGAIGGSTSGAIEGGSFALLNGGGIGDVSAGIARGALFGGLVGGVFGGGVHAAMRGASYGWSRFRSATMRPRAGTGPVEFYPPANATPDQIQQVQRYVEVANDALRAGKLSNTGRVSTQGQLRADASEAAAIERARTTLGQPYGATNHVGHGPDTTWTGLAAPPFWLDLDAQVNLSLGAQAARYPVGHQPTIFRMVSRPVGA